MDSTTTGSRTTADRRIYWFRCATAWRLIALGYLPILVGLNLVWEVLQLPLYTIWREGSASEIAYAVAHCTLGDFGIGFFALAIALTISRSGLPSTWAFWNIAAATAGVAIGYTIYSEWLNTTVRGAWVYSELMPVVPVIGTGLSPLLQWAVTPTLALALSLRGPFSRQS